MSGITRARISAALTGRTHSDATRALMSVTRTGANNGNYGKSLPQHVLDAAKAKLAIPVYVYDAATFTLVNGKPFLSYRDVAKDMPIGHSTLPRKLNTNVPFKGYYYYTTSQSTKPL
jgi:group I intron endonuclease